MSAAPSAIYIGDNTHVVEVLALEDNLGVAQLDATVSMTAIVDAVTMEDASGTQTLPLGLQHAGSGNYRATIDPGLAITASRKYLATIKAVGTQGFKAQWEEVLLAQVRRA